MQVLVVVLIDGKGVVVLHPQGRGVVLVVAPVSVGLPGVVF